MDVLCCIIFNEKKKKTLDRQKRVKEKKTVPVLIGPKSFL